MTKDTDVSLSDWIAASKLSNWRWPAGFSFAVTVVLAANLAMKGNGGLHFGSVGLTFFDALCVFSCILLATFPLWYVDTGRLARKSQRLPVVKELAICGALLTSALLVWPQFEVEYRDYDAYSDTDRRDVTTTWIKRSLAGTFRQPEFQLDELAWLSSQADERSIPNDVYCPRRSTRLWPMFGKVRDDAVANAISSYFSPTPSSAVEAAVARCRVEGPAMLQLGHTKEAALLKGDLDKFFERNEQEIHATKSIVLLESDLPTAIREKIDILLAQQPEEGFWYIENFNDLGTAGVGRRLSSLALAAAFERQLEVGRLRAVLEGRR